MHFVDYAKIVIRSGDGGNGCLSFRRLKGMPKGGPDGGHGGNGGNFIFKACKDLSTLIDYKYKRHYKAENGERGGSNNKTGANGEDAILLVPVGTLILDHETKEVICDLTKNEETYIIAKGGRGGRGNLSFKSSTNQAPRRADPVENGEEKVIILELKVLADIGIIGYPNTGKSTFISVVSNAKPKIADYPFTTLVPNLGIVRIGDNQSFAIADLPGLIKGASLGTGLGHRFLKHTERTKLLLHFLDMSLEAEENIERYEVINNELNNFSSDLSEKKQILVFNKCDLLEGNKIPKKLLSYFKKKKIKHFAISSVNKKGITDLLFSAFEELHKQN